MDYDKEIEIICKKHGSFFVTPNNHIGNNKEQIAYGCPKCKDRKKVKHKIQEFMFWQS